LREEAVRLDHDVGRDVLERLVEGLARGGAFLVEFLFDGVYVDAYGDVLAQGAKDGVVAVLRP